MFEQEQNDEPNNLGEKQVSVKQKVTMRMEVRVNSLEMLVHEFNDEPNNLGEKQVSRNSKEILGTEMR